MGQPATTFRCLELRNPLAERRTLHSNIVYRAVWPKDGLRTYAACRDVASGARQSGKTRPMGFTIVWLVGECSFAFPAMFGALFMQL
jgi:hypothetical protein